MNEQFIVSTDPKCILCREGEAKGRWQLCDRCRAELVERSAHRQARMTLTHCLVCHAPNGKPKPGKIFCPGCRPRYEGS